MGIYPSSSYVATATGDIKVHLQDYTECLSLTDLNLSRARLIFCRPQ